IRPMRMSGVGLALVISFAIDQIFCFAPSMRPDIEPVVSSTKQTSIFGLSCFSADVSFASALCDTSNVHPSNPAATVFQARAINPPPTPPREGSLQERTATELPAREGSLSHHTAGEFPSWEGSGVGSSALWRNRSKLCGSVFMVWLVPGQRSRKGRH